MRVTSETMVMRSLERLQARLTTYDQTQQRLSHGKKISVPSDDPGVARRGMSLRSELRAREQQLRNASDARSWLDTADQQLQSALTRLQRVRELTARGSTTTEPQERQVLAAEVRELAEEIAAIANTQHMGRPLFGGFTAGPAVTHDATANPPWQFAGDNDAITRRLGSDDVVRINVTAAEWLGHDAAQPGNDLLSVLDELVGVLQQGTADDASQLLDKLDHASARIGDTMAVVGASANRVISTQQRLDGIVHNLRTDLSDVEDIDIAEGVMELQTQQVAYEATLQALARALPPSLAAFLR